MLLIKDLFKKYFLKIDLLDLELIVSRVLNKPREFILAHPEYKFTESQMSSVKYQMSRRIKGEPLAHILGHREFYGLDFVVNKNVLIPRPETELLVEHVISNLKLVIRKNKKIIIADIGTGSGNIIVSITKWLEKSELPITNYQLLATDISNKVLAVARKNAKLHKVNKKIKFLRGNLLSPLIKAKSYKLKAKSLIIIANLPYLSPKIYKNTLKSVRDYEPKKALLSQKNGLEHYEKLFKQVKKLSVARLPARQVSCWLSVILEFSPEQKPALQKLIKKYFLEAKINFYKDLFGKWRVCEIKKFEAQNSKSETNPNDQNSNVLNFLNLEF